MRRDPISARRVEGNAGMAPMQLLGDHMQPDSHPHCIDLPFDIIEESHHECPWIQVRKRS